MTSIRITHDGSFDIAIGRNRKETSWKNNTTQWSELLDKLSNTHRTAETHAEYIAAKKERQDEIKDVGGFVGGYLTGGRRKSPNVLHRQLVTLDIDFGDMSFWEDFCMMYGNAACMYTTHKHCSSKPRMRLLLPLDREVRPDEYEAISRRVAGVIGIEVFDPTTFQPERLMYWPSSAKDGEYVFEYQDGDWLCADEILASYRDWRDVSQWPVSIRVNSLVRKGIDKQGDPLEKPGVIGAFCRVYGIEAVIDKYLSDVYTSCDVEGRYTYVGGSTSGGMVVYDDKYAYSHHGTDPTSGKLCNAFDLVRLHKFGLRDEDCSEKTPTNKTPSYLAMVDLAVKDTAVKNLIMHEKLDGAKRDFEGVVDADTVAEPEDDSWKTLLDVDGKLNVRGTIDNILLIFENDAYLKGRIAYDDFEKCEVALKDLPWRKEKYSYRRRRLTDRDDSSIRHYLEKAYGISHVSKTNDAMLVWSQKTEFHPVRDYLNSVEWDGEKRVDSVFIDYQGAEDCAYTRIVTRKTLVAAVARIFNPGVKFDNVPVLVGKQGAKKSSLIAKLGRQWFSDSFSFNMLAKNETKAYESMQGVWITEIAEMSGMAKAEVEAVKHFVSKTEDRFRVAYGRKTEIFPRQGIFIGSVNMDDFLLDPTGNRRWWPIRIDTSKAVKDVFTDLTDAEVSQIWAEAVQMYKKGETLYLPENMAAIAAEVQEAHTKQHPWSEIIHAYLEEKVPANWHSMSRFDRANWLHSKEDFDEIAVEEGVGLMYKSRVCLQELWHEALGKREVIDERSATAIKAIMVKIKNWEELKEQMRFGTYGKQRRGFVRKETPYLVSQQPPQCASGLN